MDAHDRLAEFDDGIVAEHDAYPVAGADVIGSENRGELAAPPFELCISDPGLEPPRRHTRKSDPVGRLGDALCQRLRQRTAHAFGGRYHATPHAPSLPTTFDPSKRLSPFDNNPHKT